MRNRHGVALLTVILVAALVLISIVSIAERVTTEGTIVNGQNLSKNALSVAEAGLADVLADLRSAQWTAATVSTLRAGSYLTPAQVNALALSSAGAVTVTAKVQPYPVDIGGASSSEYCVKIVKSSSAYWNGSSSWHNTVQLKIYSSAWVYAQAAATHDQSTAVARRIVYAVYDVDFDLDADVTETRSDLFNYGILSGCQMNFGGNGSVTGGNVRSLTGIDVGSKVRVDSTHTTISPTTPTGNSNVLKTLSSWYSPPPNDHLSLPTTLDLDAYRSKALAFKTGSAPYNGTAGYPDTRLPEVQKAIQDSLGSGAASSTDAIDAFQAHLAAGDGSWGLVALSVRQSLLASLSKAVYFIEGDGKFTNKGGSTIKGTVVMNGNLNMDGGSINAGSGGLALLVQGNIEVGNGGGTIVGAVFATGNLGTLNGNFYVKGSIAVAGTVEKGSGTFTVEYEHPAALDPVIVRTSSAGVNGRITSVAFPSSGGSSVTTPWREASSANFDDPIGHPK